MAFKVIIVGAGPVGLTLAHALLHLADVDITILERRIDLFEDTGASLILNPPSLRIFQQLGLLSSLRQLGEPLRHHSQSFDFGSNSFRRFRTMDRLQENLGCALTAFHRADLIRFLRESLPETSRLRVLTGKKLVDIVTKPEGVEVLCSDGTSYSGTLVVGADGAHSKTRSIMRRHALDIGAEASTWDAESPFTAHYRCLWASFPRPSDPGDSYETQGKDRSAMYLTGREKGWLFLYEKLPRPSKERNHYDEKSVASFADRFAEWHLTEKLTVSDVLQQHGSGAVIAGVSDLEEGIVRHVGWAGRIVLVGDAAHKFTPNSGLGFNNGVQDVAALYNQLVSLRSQDAAALQTAFDLYQQERSAALDRDFQRSAGATRMSAWATRVTFLLSRFFYSIEAVQTYFADKNSDAMAGELVLEGISAEEPFSGQVPWKYGLR